MSASRLRSPAALAGAAALAAALVLVPQSAHAHVTVTPDAPAVAGGHGVLAFAFSHGCDGAPTTAVTIGIPAGIASVAPTVAPGWDIAVVRGGGGTGMVEEVVFTAADPVPDGLRAELTLGVGYAPESAGTQLVFPVIQTCTEGEHAWTEIAQDGDDPHGLDAPAPVVTVGPAAAAHEGHGAEGSATAAGADADGDRLGVWLGAGGLVLGAAGLVTGAAAFRRTRR
ncbi:YcnI family protein [Microbacterium sp. GXF7504]